MKAFKKLKARKLKARNYEHILSTLPAITRNGKNGWEGVWDRARLKERPRHNPSPEVP